jgi:pimeloyl-ACP methyl ester carboxylesterase
MVKAKPASTRLVAFSLRGYDDSSPFEDEDLATGQAITNAMGRDFISMVNYVVERLAVLSTEGSTLTILSWSLGAALVVAGYGTLLTINPSPAPICLLISPR